MQCILASGLSSFRSREFTQVSAMRVAYLQLDLHLAALGLSKARGSIGSLGKTVLWQHAGTPLVAEFCKGRV